MDEYLVDRCVIEDGADPYISDIRFETQLSEISPGIDMAEA